MLKLFLSYSHEDEREVEKFLLYSAPLRSGKDAFEVWYDRYLISGTNFDQEIKLHLEESDGAILFLSPHFLNSQACMDELKICQQLNKERDFLILTIVVKRCLWESEVGVRGILTLNTDAKSLSNFRRKEDGWMDVIRNLREVLSHSHRKFEEKRVSPPTLNINVNVTVTFDSNFQNVLKSLAQFFQLTVENVQTSHFAGDTDSSINTYQITDSIKHILPFMEYLYENVDPKVITNIELYSHKDGIEKDHLSLLQTINMVKYGMDI